MPGGMKRSEPEDQMSNHGRMTNNLHGKFYMHKAGYAHFTLSGVNKKIETYTDKLVAEHFLEKPEGCNKIWHIDRNKNNCYYKNLIWVNENPNPPAMLGRIE